MDAAELIEQLESIQPDDLDQEIERAKERVRRLEQLRKLIGTGARPARQKRESQSDSAAAPTELATQVIATLEALGPSKAGTIAAQLGVSPQAVGIILSRIAGAEQNDDKVWSLPSQRKRRD